MAEPSDKSDVSPVAPEAVRRAARQITLQEPGEVEKLLPQQWLSGAGFDWR